MKSCRQLPIHLRRPLLPWLAALALLTLTACSNTRPGTGAPPANGTRCNPPPSELVLLRPVYRPGMRFRTVRTLRVTEKTELDPISTESVEITLTQVLRVDESGRMLAVRKTWESSVTRFRRGFGETREARGSLDGCALELTQLVGGVEARVVAGDVDLGARKFVLEGFDAALLPVQEVKPGARWTIEKRRLSGLNRILQTMQFEVEKNRLLCKFIDLRDGIATIVLDWRLSGEIHKRAAVLHFTGEIKFDTAAKLVTRLSLQGGRDNQSRQIRIEVSRRPVKGWLDLDD